MRNLFKVILFVLFLPKLAMSTTTNSFGELWNEYGGTFTIISEPILAIDSGNHQSRINRDLIITSDGRYLVSASIDKTIRVWDVETKKEVRKILGQIKSGVNGTVNTIALSPDDKWLAVGGFFGEKGGDDATNVGTIRIYDFNSGEIVKLLVSHKNAIYDLHFSDVFDVLLSASADNKIKVWHVNNNFQLIDTLKGHNGGVYAVRMLSDGKIVSAGLDKQLLLWDQGEIIAKYRHINILDSLAINNDKIAVSSQLGQQIMIFDNQLNLLKTIESKTKPFALTFSPNGRYLLAGTPTYPFQPIVYDSYNDFSIKSIFKKYNDLAEGVGFLDNNTAITGGGSNNDIYFWDINSLQIIGHIAGNGNSVQAVGADQKGIKWGNTQEGASHNNNNQLEHYFNLENFNIVSIKDFQPISTRWGDWSLSHRPGGDFLYSDAILVISNKGKDVATIARDGSNGHRHLSYGFTNDGTIVSGGANGFLIAYNRQGKKIVEFPGHTGDVLSIAISDGKLLSGAADQTIKIWNISDLKNNRPKIDVSFLTTLQEGILQKEGVKLSMQELMKLLDNSEDTDQNIYLSAKIDKDSLILSFFFDNQGEWVAWTKSGYYAASTNGDKYVGFHINHGADKAADFVPALQFYDSLYRPDIVKLAWRLGSEELAIVKAQKVKKTKIMDTVQLLPPRIILKSPVNRYIKTSNDSVIISFCVEVQNNTPLTGIDIMLNGRPTKERGLKIKYKKSKNKQCFNSEVVLSEREKHQSITITARNQHSSANPVLIEVERIIQKIEDIYKPNLYVLSIGVSDYKDDQYDLEFADKDASAITQVFSKQKSLFRTIKQKQLLNRDATKDNILDALDWIDQESTQRDLSVIFLAGHGVNNSKGSYYFLPYDANVDKLRRTGVKWSEFKDVVTELPGKTLLLVDSCRSGNIMGGKSRGIGENITSAIKSITSEGTGQVIMTASTGSSVSIEDPKWGHGAFTKALIEGIDGRADYDDNGIVSVKELDLYVTSEVKKLTKGRQKPTTIIPRSVPDFAVGAN